jgi:predicted CXXCH cytochrome family protein
MNKRAVCPVLAVIVGVFSGTGMALASQGCLSGTCHQSLTKFRYLHGPLAAEMAGVKACVVCHEPAGPECTVTKGGIFKLKSKTLCLTCHDKGTGTQHTQEQVAAKCLACHDPHGSDSNPQLLRAKRK